MRRGLIADLHKCGRPIEREAARELTQMRRILQHIINRASDLPLDDRHAERIRGLAEQGLKLTKQ